MIFEESRNLNDRFLGARKSLVAMFPGDRRPGKTYSEFVQAGRRLGPQAMEVMKAHVREHHQGVAGIHWKRFGGVAFAAEGSRVEVPRTACHPEAFGGAGRDKTGPQLALTTLDHLGTGLPWDWRIGAGTDAERSHLRVMRATLPDGAWIVADAGFTGYDLRKDRLEGGRSSLIRVGAHVSWLTKLFGVEVEQEGDTVGLWPQDQRNLRPLKLRLIRLPRKSGSPQEAMYGLTNVFDRQRRSEEIAASRYERRWGVEVFDRAFQRTLDQHQLRRDAPEQAKGELHGAMMAFWLRGLMTVEGIIDRGRDPRSRSVAAAWRIVRQAMGEPQRRRRHRGDLRFLWGEAQKDESVRKSSKKARDWPHKKTESPPGVPNIRPATWNESLKAQRVYAAA